MLTQVLKYGIHRFLDEDAAFIQEQGKKAHAYYNNLLALGLEQRAREEVLMGQFIPELAPVQAAIKQLSDQIDAIYKEIKRARKVATIEAADGAEIEQKHARKTPATPAQKAEIDALRAERRKAYEQAAPLVRKFWDLVQPGIMAFDVRSTGVDPKLIQEIADLQTQIKAARKEKDTQRAEQLTAQRTVLLGRKKALAPKTYKKRSANQRVLEEMLSEPWPEAWKALATMRREIHERSITLRGACGLSHGTYVSTEDAVKQAFKMAAKHGNLPKFRKYHQVGGRKIGIQLQKSTPLSGSTLVAGADTRLSLTKTSALPGSKDPARFQPRQPNSLRQRMFYGALKMRLSSKSMDTHTVRAEVIAHRPIPADANIKWAFLVSKRLNSQETEHSLQLTCDLERPLIERSFGTGECIVKFRWTLDAASAAEDHAPGLIVAELNGQPFVLDGPIYSRKTKERPYREYRGNILSAFRFSDGLRSTADTLFDSKKDRTRGAKGKLMQWMEENPALVPPWMAIDVAPVPASKDEQGRDMRGRAGIAAWRHSGRLREIAEKWIASTPWCSEPSLQADSWSRTRITELWHNWKMHQDEIKRQFGPERGNYHVDNRAVLNAWLAKHGIADSESQMAVWLEWWRRKDMHLEIYSTRLRRRAMNYRDDIYQCKVVELSRQFGKIKILNSDLKRMAERPEVDKDEDEIHRAARNQRFIASPHTLKDAFFSVFGKERIEIIKDKPTEDTSKKSKRSKKKPDAETPPAAMAAE